MTKNKIIIFDLWQTLADTQVRPSEGMDLLSFTLKPKETACGRDLFSSEIFTKDLPLEHTVRSFLQTQEVARERAAEDLVAFWKKCSAQAYLIPGAMEFLRALRNKGYHLCLLTNIDKYGYENFLYQDLLDMFDCKILSYQVGILKPDLGCWDLIRDHYNSDYQNMIMVGNSLEEDILPAKKLSVATFQVNFDTLTTADTIWENLRQYILDAYAY